ncbi:MAG: class I SAM-dependent methyltransferase [Verrucomicrobiota bacterium]|jgi:2-polyprenyl-3-methyl-5-hydroxy-6-metoxy-1,4-benzoquinol methylase
MNAIESYYSYQAVARGLTSDAAVEELTNIMSGVYDRLLPRWLPSDRKAEIYEVACGPGIMLRYLKRRGYTKLGGSDSSASQIELAQAGGLSVVVGDSLEALKRRSRESLDCIIAIDFIEHLAKDVLVEFLAESHRTLRKDGRLILRAPNGDSPLVGRNLFNDITHYWAYTSIATEALLKMAGFQRVEFADECLASIRQWRWIKVPLMKCSQALLRALIRSATRENVQVLGSSIYAAAWK